MSSCRKYLFLALWGVFAWGTSSGQAAQTPFSTFGIGEQYGNAMIHNQGMAGVGIGTPQYWFMNSLNPANLVYNRLTIFQAGIIFEQRAISGESTDERSRAGNMNYLAMAFPIEPGKWTSAIGLAPYTNVDYRLQYTQPITGSPNTAVVSEEGSGGLTQAYWSNGVRLTRNLAVGLKAAYIFSSINNEYANIVNAQLGVPFQISVSEKVTVTDFNFQAGLSFRKDSVGNGLNVSAGAVYTFGTALKARQTVTFARNDLLDRVIDSLTLTSNRGSYYVPSELGIGFSVGKGYAWTVGADFVYQDWTQFRGLPTDDPDGLVASWRAALGIELTPDPYALESFFKKLTYRGGVSIEKYPFLANNNEVRDFGINFGLSVPTGRSSLDMAFRVGKRGNKSDNVLEETYYKVYFGITLNDQWFIKRKFD